VDASGQKVATISLKSHPESFQLEEGNSRIFVNCQKYAVAVVDRTKRTVIAKWGLDWTFANYPMALDEADKDFSSAAVFLRGWKSYQNQNKHNQSAQRNRTTRGQ
jgi:hypothetical protein